MLKIISMKRFTLTVILLCVCTNLWSHVGSPGVTFEGKAGEHNVMAMINPPDVIPGTAIVDIFTSTQGIVSVFGKPVFWIVGDKGTPQADELLPVPGEPGHYHGMIWLMDAGTWAIEVTINGEKNNGMVVVPVMAVSTVQREMNSSLGWMLACLGALLCVLMVTIISSSVSDSLVHPDDIGGTSLRRKKWKGAVVSSILIVALLFGGKTWWDSWASDYQRYMYKPFRADTQVIRKGSKNELVFSIDTTRLSNLTFTRNISYIIPDHGKLMHTFLVRQGSMDVFAHLHPKRRDSVTFVTTLPALPKGKYLLFSDVTRLSGFSETIADTFEISHTYAGATFASLDSTGADADDTFFYTNPVSATNDPIASSKVITCGKPGVRMKLQDGSTITWEQDPAEDLQANSLYSLKFSVKDTDGSKAILEPYLGMAGHAVVMKDDGTVYIHLHPVGSYSMASQETMVNRFARQDGPIDIDKLPKPKAFRDSIDQYVSQLDAMPGDLRDSLLMGNMLHTSLDGDHPDHAIVSFPYAFPVPGNYRIWIQMKRNGRILNSAFDAQVK